MLRPRLSRVVVLLALAGLPLAIAGCVKALPPTDTGDSLNPIAPDSPSSPTGASQALAYDPDMKPVFASDCVACHGGFRADAGYVMTSYAQVMRAVRPGDARSVLVVVTQRNGSMYRYFSGNRATRSQMVLDWVVANQAAETR